MVGDNTRGECIVVWIVFSEVLGGAPRVIEEAPFIDSLRPFPKISAALPTISNCC